MTEPLVDLPADVVAKIVAEAESSGGAYRDYDRIGGEYGLLGSDVAGLVDRDRRRRDLAPLRPVKPVKKVEQPRRQSRTTLHKDQLYENPANIRDRLGDLTGLTRSIKDLGLLQPLIVTEHVEGFLIIDGHRRFAAGMVAGLENFACTVRHRVEKVSDQVVLMLVANGQRVDLDAVERAQAFQGLVDAGISQREVALRCGVAESTVSDSLTLLTLDDDTLDLVRGGRISAYEAIKMIREVRRADRTTTGRPQRGRKPSQQQRLSVSATEGAALSRLLYEHLATDCDCAGHADLEQLVKRVQRLRLDHSAYADLSALQGTDGGTDAEPLAGMEG